MEKVNFRVLDSLLRRSKRIVDASKRLLGDCGVEVPGLATLQRDLRDAIRQVASMAVAQVDDEDRPLLKS